MDLIGEDVVFLSDQGVVHVDSPVPLCRYILCKISLEMFAAISGVGYSCSFW